MGEFKPFRFEKVSVHNISGIRFKTVVEDYLFYDEQGAPEASIYIYSYVAQPERADRPVLFG